MSIEQQEDKSMSVSKVYYTDLRVKNGDNLLTKLQRLIKTAGIGAIDF